MLERSGQWFEACDCYDQAYRLCLTDHDCDSLLETIVRIGHCHRQAGNSAAAAEVLELSSDLGELSGDASLSGRALNGLGILKHDQGDIDAAHALYLRAREHALRAGDGFTAGSSEQNLGILANIRGDLAGALDLYRAGLDNLEKAAHRQGCASVLNNLGMLHVDLGELQAADEYFRRALDICSEISDVVTAGIVHLNRTELFLARGESELARASCDEAFETFSRVGQEDGRAEAMKFYGLIYKAWGKPHLSAAFLRQAIQIGSQHGFLLVEAESQRELAFVLREQGQNREGLQALNRAHHLFTHLQASQDQADVRDRIQCLQEDFLSLVSAWGESIEAKDRYTRGHCQRVADYACRLAEEVGIGAADIVWFRMGAFLHDVGKTEVPAEILNKPGALTDEERMVMERHTSIGEEILTPVEFPWDVRPMVRSHHERWDGRGYPDGLAEEAIPYPARILRIADIFDALTTARSYRRPLSPEEAFGIMEEDVGSFDPEVFATFRKLFSELSGQARAARVEAVGTGSANGAGNGNGTS